MIGGVNRGLAAEGLTLLVTGTKRGRGYKGDRIISPERQSICGTELRGEVDPARSGQGIPVKGACWIRAVRQWRETCWGFFRNGRSVGILELGLRRNQRNRGKRSGHRGGEDMMRDHLAIRP